MTPALVLGSAACLRDDLIALRAWIKARSPKVFAVNDAGWIYHGHIDHWVTLHWERMEHWRKQRPESCGMDYETWCRTTVHTRGAKVKPTHYAEMWVPKAGTSAFFAVQIALKLGHAPIVLAGCPMTATAYTDGAGTWDGDWPQTEMDIHWPAWELHKDRLGDVRSMSGRTAELLGKPTPEFLYG